MLSSRNRHRLFRTAFSAIALTRADRWLAPVARGRGLILTFHHVRPEAPAAYAANALLAITPDFLDRTLTHLGTRGFEIIGLDEVPARLREPAPRAPFAVLTFDDGYRDNVAFAAPVLASHRAPWTLFVTCDFADGRGRLWWIELERAIARLDRVQLQLGSTRQSVLDLPARDAPEKTVAFDAAYRVLRAWPEDRLLSAIAGLCEEAGFAPGRIAEELCLSWDELRALDADPDVTIGAHTVSHPMLAKHGPDVARREIAESRARIARELGREIRHLSYPVGDPTSAGPREFAIASDLGFDTAVTTRPGHLFADQTGHLHALPRVSINGLHQTEAALASLISGVPFLAWYASARIKCRLRVAC